MIDCAPAAEQRLTFDFPRLPLYPASPTSKTFFAKKHTYLLINDNRLWLFMISHGMACV